MKTYDEKTWEEIEEPDLSAGYTYAGQRFVMHHEAQAEQSHLEIMPGTEAMNGGQGLRGKVVDVPAQDAWDEYEDCLLYHAYTAEELAAMQPPEEPSADTEARLAALGDELAAAKILLGVE